jgi:cation diffusion facilitator family transporter
MATHDHTHGTVDPSLFSTQRGLWAVKWSCLLLLMTAALQAVVVWYSGSTALLADTIHNLGDAGTAIPLWFAFRLSHRKPTKRFTYGFGRMEDIAGVLIVFAILASAITAGYTSLVRLSHPVAVDHLAAVVAASLIGFAGNEAAAFLRIRVGKEIGSASLIADGHHARADGLTSLAVLAGALGVGLGFPKADPIVGLLISLAILHMAWDAGKGVLNRLIDRVDGEIVDEILHTIEHVEEVRDTGEVRVRWIGHRLHAEINLAVDDQLSVLKAHEIADRVRHEILHHLPFLSAATIHVDPATRSGETHHRIPPHQHGSSQLHGH